MELWYALVDLLPFDWAQPGSMYFMKNALLAVLVISPLFGVLSTMVVHSRMSFFSDALGHSAFTGMAIGAICGFNEPTWAAVLFAVVFALLFNLVRRRSALASDTVIGVFSSTAVALGIFLSTLGGRSFTKFNSLLIGDILSVEPEKIALLAGILLVVLVLWGVSFNQLMLSAVHPALADSRGVKVFWQETVFSVAIAVVVTVSMTWVGLLVINSLLVRGGGPECVPDHVPVPSGLPAGGGAGRDRGADDLLLCGLLRRGGHHPLSGGVVPDHLPGPEKAVNSNKNSRRPPAVFVVSNLKVLVLQGAEIRLGGAGRDALEGIVSKGTAVGAGGHDAFLVADHLRLVQGTAAGAVDTAGLDLLLKQGQRGHLPCHRY